MTVSSGLNRISYAGNGTTTVFPVNYYFLDNTHLQVILISSTGVEAQQTLTSNYTVTGAGNEAGGTVTMLVAPPAGTTLVIQRNVPATQETDYLANDPFPAESHERALDKLTMLVQQNEREAGRALKIPLAAVPTTSTELPLPQGNKLLAWNSNASAITNLDPSDVITVVGQQNSFADVFTGNGVTTSFTLTRNPGSVFNIDVSINGVTQVPNVDYILAATTLTFTSAPPAVASQILARYSEVFTLADADAANVRYLPAGGVQTNVQAKLREIVSVKDFGAVGDGVTDDTAAIQAAIDTLTSQSALTFPPGTYNVSDNLTFAASNISVVGYGAKIVQTGSLKRTFYFDSLTNIEISGLHFYGKGSSDFDGASATAGTKGAAMWFDTCTYLNIHDNLIENCAGGHIRSRYDGSYSQFVNNRIVGIGTAGGIVRGDNGVDVAIDIREAVALKSKNIVIANNVISDTCFGIFVGNGDGVTISNNTVRDIPGQHGIYNNACSNMAIANNTFDNIALIGMKAQQLVSGSGVLYNYSITGNVINNATSGIAFELASGDPLLDYTEGVTINGNTITNITTEYGMSLDSCRQLVVSNNVIDRCGLQGVFTRRSGLITISNNLINLAGANGIWLNGLLDDASIENNTIKDAVQNYASSTFTDGSFYYYTYAVASVSAPNKPKCFVKNNTFILEAAEPTLYASNGKVYRAITGVDSYWQNNINLTTKGIQFEPADLIYMDFGFSKSVDYTTAGSRDPNPPKYGRGRRELYGTTDPASASMTDTFMRGDVCWHATPSAGGKVGWVCTTGGAPGTWKAFGVIDA
jgi:parallel beta-helix repeat protein